MSSVWLRVPRPAAQTTIDLEPDLVVEGAGQRDREVEEGAAVGVEPDQQPARPLDDHGVVVLRERADPVDVVGDRRDRDALPAGGGVGRERLVECGELEDRATGEPLDDRHVTVRVVDDAGLHRLHDQDVASGRRRQRGRGDRLADSGVRARHDDHSSSH